MCFASAAGQTALGARDAAMSKTEAVPFTVLMICWEWKALAKSSKKGTTPCHGRVSRDGLTWSGHQGRCPQGIIMINPQPLL